MVAKVRAIRGFTLIELMITLIILAIAVALATPSYQKLMEKRRVTAAAEEIVGFVNLGQTLAVKTNDMVSVKWSALTSTGSQSSSASHPKDWCIGMYQPASLPDPNTKGVAAGCDCRIEDPANGAACTVDGALYQFRQDDFVKVGSEFMDFEEAQGHFTFDPVRGFIVGWSDPDLVDGSHSLFQFHSSDATRISGIRLYELRARLRVTGQVRICNDSGRAVGIGGYPAC